MVKMLSNPAATSSVPVEVDKAAPLREVELDVSVQQVLKRKRK